MILSITIALYFLEKVYVHSALDCHILQGPSFIGTSNFKEIQGFTNHKVSEKFGGVINLRKILKIQYGNTLINIHSSKEERALEKYLECLILSKWQSVIS